MAKEDRMSDELFGWVDDPAEVETVVARMRYPVAGLAMSHDFLATAGEHRDVMLWKLEEQLLGKTLPAHRQTIGDCVSHGWGKAVQLLVYREHLLAGTPPDQVLDIATEPIYGFSRVEVGRGRLGNGDGSIGAWAAEAVLKYGNLERKRYSNIDLTTYSGSLAKRWGSPRSGVPDELEPTAAKHIVAMAPLVVSEDETKAALYNGYPIPVCSGQGFITTRDRYGFCDPRGSWRHCMCSVGIVEAKRGSGFVLAVPIQQSWGNSPTGPDEFETRDGQTHKLPQGCFLIEFDVFLRMLKGRDSFAPAGPQGFVKLPEFIFGPH